MEFVVDDREELSVTSAVLGEQNPWFSKGNIRMRASVRQHTKLLRPQAEYTFSVWSPYTGYCIFHMYSDRPAEANSVDPD